MTSLDRASIEHDIKSLPLSYSKMDEAKKDWDMKKYNNARQGFDDILHRIMSSREVLEQIENEWLSDIQQQLQSFDYSQKIESLLRENNITFSGQFPDYSIPPFKLSFNLAKNLVKFSMGKELKQIYILEPHRLVDYVSQRHRAIMCSRFDHEQFCKELMSAYKYLSPSNWRRQVSVKDIYQLLTIKVSAKQEYPESSFMFDLARLLQLPTIEYAGFYFEFAANKESKRNYFVTDSQGKEKTIGLVSIYPKESNS